MAAITDTGLDFFRQVLALRGYRQEILAADIANASTPGFKAVDLDFVGALDAAITSRPGVQPQLQPRRLLLIDDARQLPADAASGSGGGAGATAQAAGSFVKYQSDSEVTLDGNSVDLNHEKVAAAENAVQYEAAATFASQTVHMMMVAITGSGSQQSGGG